MGYYTNFEIKVISIHRYEFAGLTLGTLKEGKYRTLRKNEIRKNVFK